MDWFRRNALVLLKRKIQPHVQVLTRQIQMQYLCLQWVTQVFDTLRRHF